MELQIRKFQPPHRFFRLSVKSAVKSLVFEKKKFDELFLKYNEELM